MLITNWPQASHRTLVDLAPAWVDGGVRFGSEWARETGSPRTDESAWHDAGEAADIRNEDKKGAARRGRGRAL